MKTETICKTIHQYNKIPVSEEDMKKLLEIAGDYSKVKNYVYQRYGGIKSVSKIYPGYTVQNEMTNSGLRSELGMPSVYFYLAVFEALGDIKTQWTQIRSRVLQSMKQNENLTPHDLHYIRFIFKISSCFEAILLYQKIQLPVEIQRQYESLCNGLDIERLHNYVRRQVRKQLKKMHTNHEDGFAITAKAYRYDNHGIYISVKEKRKRIFLPLTDGNQYTKQLYIKLYPDKRNIEIKVPVESIIKKHDDFNKKVGISLGMLTMLTTDEGHVYGEKYGMYQEKLTDYVRRGNNRYHNHNACNPGRMKYINNKNKLTATLHTYINQELNRFVQQEKPKMIYVPKLPQVSGAGVNKRINNSVSMWQRGYIRMRLLQKAAEHSIEIIEVLGKDISKECCVCGKNGEKVDGMFQCKFCGTKIQERMNAARNAYRRGIEKSS